LHAEVEAGVAAGALFEEAEEIPLRHEGDELAVGGEVGEIGDGDDLLAKVGLDFADFLVGLAEEVIEEAELVHELEGGGVDGIAAEIAEEVLVLFEDEDIDSGAGEEEGEEHASRAAASDAAGGVGLLDGFWIIHR
jgi:hypothetical protein